MAAAKYSRSKKKSSKLNTLLQKINPLTPRKRFLTFIVVFAVIGGSYFVYKSMAAVNTPVFFFRNFNNAGNGDAAAFAYGNPGDMPIACDWDGNRSDGIGVLQPPVGEFHLSETVNPTSVTTVIRYGDRGDIPVCGDWNGDRRAGVGVFRPSTKTWYLADNINKAAGGRNATAGVTKEVKWGDAGDIPLVCDWNGDGKDDIGLYRPSNAHFYISLGATGWTDHDIHFGNGGDLPVCGNWDGVGSDGIGVYRPSTATYYLSDTILPTRVNYEFVYGNPGDKPIVGDWDGNGTTTVGITRMGDIPKPVGRTPQKSTYTCVGDTVIEVKDKATCDAILLYAQLGRQLEQQQSQAPAPAPAATNQLLSRGSSGGAVSSLQQRLANRGFWIGVTGNFDHATEVTVRSFQAVRGISSDGIVGPQTYGQLGAAEAEGWIFNPNDPRLAAAAVVRALPVVVDRVTNVNQSISAAAQAAAAAGLTADAINRYFELLRAAEAAARVVAIRNAAEAVARHNQNNVATQVGQEASANAAAVEAAKRAAQTFRNLR